MMYSDNSQWSAFSNPQPWAGLGQGSISQGAFGQGAFGTSLGGAPVCSGPELGRATASTDATRRRRHSAADCSGAAQIIAQAQQNQQYQQYHPMAAYGGGFGFNQRSLFAQDVSEVVRQILPMIPQVLQSVQQQGAHGRLWLADVRPGRRIRSTGSWLAGAGRRRRRSAPKSLARSSEPQQRHLSHHDVDDGAVVDKAIGRAKRPARQAARVYRDGRGR